LRSVRRRRQKQCGRAFYYSAIVCSTFDRFHRTEVTAQPPAPSPTTRNFLLEVAYAYPDEGTSRRRHFLIDVVEYKQLDIYLNAIVNDVEAARLNWRR
jgi:hypothetical protein